MTRIYTNVPSMVARTNLNRNMSALQTSLERLSTGFRINSGKDDPSGLIASEMLRSDITGLKFAIRNTERANQMIATADSALSEVTNLLNDLRGLVTEAANTGAMSAEMIAANQLQVDASLDAIDRIATMTTFMGKKLLDGSLDFDISGINRSDIHGLHVNQVTFGSSKTPITVDVEVREPAKQAELYYYNPVAQDDIVLQWGSNDGYYSQQFSKGATVSQIADAVNNTSNSTGVVAEVGSDAIYGSIITSSLGLNNDIIITSGIAGEAGGNVEIKYVAGSTEGIYVEYQEALGADSPAKIIVHLQTEAEAAAMAGVVDTTAGIHDNNALKFTANIPGDQYNNASIHYVDGQGTQPDWNERIAEAIPLPGGGTAYADYNDNATAATAVVTPSAFASAVLTDQLVFSAAAAGSSLNNVAINFLADQDDGTIPPGKAAAAVYRVDESGNKYYNIYMKDGATLSDIQAAVKLDGTFHLDTKSNDLNTVFTTTGLLPDTGNKGNTHNSGGEAGTLFVYLDKNADGTPVEYSANDMAMLFSEDSPYSRGSERAASLFDVQRTSDNDGTGTISLGTNAKNMAFENAFKDGVSAGTVVSTAAEVVTALNNSAFWNSYALCPEVLAQLAEANAAGQYADPLDANGVAQKPVITARLAPGNNGTGVVSAFEEVAYYGDPDMGTGLQFLGGDCSPNIRFMIPTDSNGKPIANSPLQIVPSSQSDVTDYSQAVLTATNANASIVITANRKGDEYNGTQYDDVQFLFKRASESAALDRSDGWVEYDPSESKAETQVLFRDANGNAIANSAFYLTATERGDQYNNVAVMFTSNSNQAEPIVVTYDELSKQLRVSLSNSVVDAGPDQVNVNDVISAINASGVPFEAQRSYSEESNNNGTGTFENIGLKSNLYTEIANTEDSGGRTGGTVTVWLTDQITGQDADGNDIYREPNANDIIRLITNDSVVGEMFNARVYTSGTGAGTGTIDFTKDTGVVTSGGLIESGVLTVYLATDSKGQVITTAADLVAWWDKLDPELVDNISASLVRPPGAVWDECDDPYGLGILGPTVTLDDCDNWIINDIQFVGWNDDIEQQYYVPSYASGTMTSNNGVDSSYQLVARRSGPDYNGYTINYVNDPSISGHFADNYVGGTDENPCDTDDPTLTKDSSGNIISPQSSSQNGLYLTFDEKSKNITIYLRDGITTAYDIEQLIESDPYTRTLFEVKQQGDGSGVVTLQDNTLLTDGGAICPGKELNGAKLLFGSDATDYYLIFRSANYGSDAYVDVRAMGQDGEEAVWSVQTAEGKTAEKTYGTDVDAMVNGVKAVGTGLAVSLNTSNLSLDFTLSERAGSTAGYSTTFTIDGGGATYQIGPDVVTTQQITLGIPSIHTVSFGGASGTLDQLRSGNDASLKNDTNLAFRIVEEAIVAITTVRGRLGTIQKATFETNITVLEDTMEALTTAESMIRDTDFAEETSNMTRAQILVQAGISSLGIANQLPNYVLGLLGG